MCVHVADDFRLKQLMFSSKHSLPNHMQSSLNVHIVYDVRPLQPRMGAAVVVAGTLLVCPGLPLFVCEPVFPLPPSPLLVLGGDVALGPDVGTSSPSAPPEDADVDPDAVEAEPAGVDVDSAVAELVELLPTLAGGEARSSHVVVLCS